MSSEEKKKIFQLSVNIDRHRRDQINEISMRSEVFYKQGNYQKCIEDYNQILQICPLKPDVLWNRSICYDRIGKFQKEIDDLTTLINVYPNSEHMPFYCQNRGRAYYQVGNYNRCIEDSTIAISILKRRRKTKRPDVLVELYFLRGCSFEGVGILPLSVKDNREIIRLSTTTAVAPSKIYGSYLNLGNAFRKMGNFEEAVVHYKKALEFGTVPTPPTPTPTSVVAGESPGSKKTSQLKTPPNPKSNHVTKGSPVPPKNIVEKKMLDDRAYFNLGMVYYDMKLFHESLSALKKVSDSDMLEEVNYTVFSMFKESYRDERLEFIEKAKEYLEKCIAINPTYPGYYKDRGDLFVKFFKNFDFALKDYFKALELSEDRTRNIEVGESKKKWRNLGTVSDILKGIRDVEKEIGKRKYSSIVQSLGPKKDLVQTIGKKRKERIGEGDFLEEEEEGEGEEMFRIRKKRKVDHLKEFKMILL